MLKKLLLTLLLILGVAPAWAATRCTLTATGGCTSRHDTIQAAVDAASPTVLDTVKIGPGDYVEDVHVTGKGVRAIFQAGAALIGRTPFGVAWHADHVSRNELRDAVILVAPGGVGIQTSGGYLLRTTRGQIRCQGSGTGMRLVGGAEHETKYGQVEGCTVGIDAENVKGLDVEVMTFLNNGIGLRILHGYSGQQAFWNHYTNNVVGLECEACSHADLNSGTFTCGDVPDCIGFRAPLAEVANPVTGLRVNHQMEHNHNRYFGYAGRHFQIQRCDGTWTNDVTLSPESVEQYADNWADGVRLPNFTTPRGVGCP